MSDRTVRPTRSWSYLLLLLPLAGLVAVGLWWWRRPESTAALRGRRVAEAMGCFTCHGVDGRGGVADPGARGDEVPGWAGPTVATLCRDEAEVREWILEGRPARLEALARVAQRAPLVPMPAYRGRLKPEALGDLLVYFRAVSGFGRELPDPAYEGWKVADRLGCFACHGPSGIGGAPNPGSFKGHIPAWDGAEYPELVENEAEFREWTLDGRVERLWSNRLARPFLENQVIQMPAYRAQISDAQLGQLVAYVNWLRSAGAAPPGAVPATGGRDEAHKILGLLLAGEGSR